tara:strand:+ start:503 stop:844 length:342 start_codon:yes stop_codon:yes gene_type:complete
VVVFQVEIQTNYLVVVEQVLQVAKHVDLQVLQVVLEFVFQLLFHLLLLQLVAVVVLVVTLHQIQVVLEVLVVVELEGQDLVQEQQAQRTLVVEEDQQVVDQLMITLVQVALEL